MDLPIKSVPESTGNSGRNARYFIETNSVSYELPAGNSSHKTILKNVTCQARPGELLAIVGPSGAGKSTLLSVLAGAIQPGNVSGRVLVNGREMEASSFSRISGYVTQDDTLFPMLTVEETLAYSARFRLGSTLREAILRARALLLQLGLVHVASSRIGGPGTTGISGGERRRVSIGVELVHNPAVLLLDEPTTGLDSSSAHLIVAMLKSMVAANGKTVIFTIHQPGFRILELLDRVVLIADGVLRYQGPLSVLQKWLEEGGHVIPPHVNVLEYAMDAMEILAIETHMLGSCRVPYSVLRENREKNKYYYANSPINEVLILAERFAKNMVRTKQVFVARMIQSAVAGLGLGTIFMNADNQQAKVGFFAFSLTFHLSSAVEGLPIFLQERRILMRETSRGAYRVTSYVIANSLVFLPFLFAASILYATPVYWLIGLRREIDNFLFFSLVIWLVMLMANAFVACFGALVPNFIMGNSVIAGLMGSFFLFSGYFISKQNIPRYWIFMYYLSLFKYPFEAFLLNEFGGEKGRKECIQSGKGGCHLTGEMLLRQQGMEESHKWSNLGVMFGFICVYRILSLVILWIRCLKIRR
ncbi:ABC transporter G family member 10-like [Dendrobium catenatum]|uniref:ABC transporter G family member 10 n=1 Tax=Dendrobium catenatum TaxID=906689 RepID=A0A2I0VXL2_9ASPA|nr:ABC transporter G family member 10-like [Dendrobium catenatum]PKU68144.1 ABC transporter G family member 10 [Dendrobium catenatum]